MCNFVGLPETRRDGPNGFTAATCAVYCSGEAGGDVTDAKGQHRTGLAIKEPILQDVEKDRLATQHISALLTKVRLNLKGGSNGCTFLCGCVRSDR